MPTLFLFGASEGGLFDFAATLPLMAVQVVLLTFILNALFFNPVGRVVEEREDYVNTSRAEAKKKIAEVERLETELKDQLKEARLEAQKVILEAEQIQRIFTKKLLLLLLQRQMHRERKLGVRLILKEMKLLINLKARLAILVI